MELGLRALVAAGAQSVMTLHSCRYFAFTPEIGADGKLANAAAFEEYLQSVRTEGAPLNTYACILACVAALGMDCLLIYHHLMQKGLPLSMRLMA
jgi:hypothetical protein